MPGDIVAAPAPDTHQANLTMSSNRPNDTRYDASAAIRSSGRGLTITEIAVSTPVLNMSPVVIALRWTGSGGKRTSELAQTFTRF